MNFISWETNGHLSFTVKHFTKYSFSAAYNDTREEEAHAIDEVNQPSVTTARG